MSPDATATAAAAEPTPATVADVRVPELDAELSPTMQRYLMAIVAAQRDAAVTATAVARALGCSPPTSLEMLRRLEASGLVTRPESRRTGWVLTAHGQREIAALKRRQSVLERFLRTTLSLTPEEAAEEAARIGPTVSGRLESRLRDAVWPAARPCREPR